MRATEGDECLAVGGRPLGLTLHPGDEVGEEGVEAAGGADHEEAGALVHGVVEAVDHAHGHVDEFAGSCSQGLVAADNLDLAFEDVEGLDEGLVIVERDSGEVAGNGELDEGVSMVGLAGRGFDVDRCALVYVVACAVVGGLVGVRVIL